jgi:hypothetical protein
MRPIKKSAHVPAPAEVLDTRKRLAELGKLDQAISFLIMKVAIKKVTIKKISRAKTSG